MDKEKIYQNAEEYGALHNEDCCCNTEYGCACDVKPLECCENMKMVKGIIDTTVERVVEFLSHDIDFESEEQ